jgi:hypothetical protein
VLARRKVEDFLDFVKGQGRGPIHILDNFPTCPFEQAGASLIRWIEIAPYVGNGRALFRRFLAGLNRSILRSSQLLHGDSVQIPLYGVGGHGILHLGCELPPVFHACPWQERGI